MTGSGTQADPYIIYNVTDLQNIENDLTAYYELGGDIDASATSGWNGGEGFDPIATFSGQLDGKGYKITNLLIDRSTSNVGLINRNDGAVQNLGLEDCNIRGRCVGSIVCRNTGTITKCYATGTLEVVTITTGYGGAFLAFNEGGTITQCYSRCNITATGSGHAWIAGFAQTNLYGGSITNCYARGAVTSETSGTSWADGFAVSGDGSGAVINCYSTGAVSGATYSYGFSPDPDLVATNCFWDTETSGQTDGGVGTGKTTAQMKTKTTFMNAGWDFITVWAMRPDRNNNYPYLQWQFVILKGNPNIDQRMFQHIERMD